MKARSSFRYGFGRNGEGRPGRRYSAARGVMVGTLVPLVLCVAACNATPVKADWRRTEDLWLHHKKAELKEKRDSLVSAKDSVRKAIYDKSLKVLDNYEECLKKQPQEFERTTERLSEVLKNSRSEREVWDSSVFWASDIVKKHKLYEGLMNEDEALEWGAYAAADENLQTLDLSSSKYLSNLTPLCALSSRITELNLAGNEKVKDFGPLSCLDKLTKLNVSKTKITNLKSLAECDKLEVFDASEAKELEDIRGLSGCDKLKEVRLCGCSKVSDLSSLKASATSLRLLSLGGDDSRRKAEDRLEDIWNLLANIDGAERKKMEVRIELEDVYIKNPEKTSIEKRIKGLKLGSRVQLILENVTFYGDGYPVNK